MSSQPYVRAFVSFVVHGPCGQVLLMDKILHLFFAAASGMTPPPAPYLILTLFVASPRSFNGPTPCTLLPILNQGAGWGCTSSSTTFGTSAVQDFVHQPKSLHSYTHSTCTFMYMYTCVHIYGHTHIAMYTHVIQVRAQSFVCLLCTCVSMRIIMHIHVHRRLYIHR